MITILQGDWIERLKELPDKSVQCCVTSPPYWGLRDYGVPGQLGLEKTPDEYVAKIVAGFREVRRALRDDGTLWLNLGDSYCSTAPNTQGDPLFRRGPFENVSAECAEARRRYRPETPTAMKPKDLVGIPWTAAFALRADGWYLRCDVIWAKKNCMPESVTDRPTKAHEYIFLLSKSQKYFYDSEAIKEQSSNGTHPRGPGNVRPPKSHVAYDNGATEHRTKVGLLKYAENQRKLADSGSGIKNNDSFDDAMSIMPEERNKRSVWTVATAPYSEAHFATFPPDLIKPCIMAGTSARGCCAKCGAPLEREVEVYYVKNRPSAGNDPRSRGEDRLGNAREVYGSGGWRGNNLLRDAKTIGWKPTCKCECPDVVPCTVLDPFGGSGTTGQVAMELGRKCTLIELNPKYITLIEQRTNVTPGLALG